MNYKEKLNFIKAFVFDVDGVLTDGKILLKDGTMSRSMNTKDGFAMQFAVKQGFPICIITGGRDESVVERFKGLNITDIYLNSHHKIEDYEDFKSKYQFNDEDILYVGDDLPDYEVMTKVGVAACPCDACWEIKTIASYVSPIKGGNGCVRDVIEQTLKVQGKWFKIPENLPQSI